MEGKSQNLSQINESIQSSQSKYLHFGSIIIIKAAYKQNSFLISNGFVDERLYLTSENVEDIANLTDDCTFRILPVSPISEYLQQTEEKFNAILKADITEKQQLIMAKNILDSFSSHAKSQQEESIRSSSAPLQFNQAFQLEHVKTKKYLTYDTDQSFEVDQNSFTLTLKENPSINSRIRISPCYKYQIEQNRYIQYNSDCFLVADYRRREVLGLKFEDGEIEDSWVGSPLKKSTSIKRIGELNKGIVQKQRQIPYTQRAFMSIEKQKIRVGLYRGSNQDKQIYCGDAVWIMQSELGSCIAYNPERAADETVYFDKSDSNNESYNNSIGLWKIEGEDLLSGGELHFQQLIRMKNINTNLYLSISTEVEESKSPEEGLLICMDNSKSEDQMFYLQSINDPSSTKPVLQTSFFKIFHSKSQMQLGKESVMILTQEGYDQQFFPVLHDKEQQEDVYRFLGGSQNEVWECYYLESCKPLLEQGLSLMLSKQKQESIDSGPAEQKEENITFTEKEKQEMSEFIRGLQLLQKFCLEGVEESDKNSSTNAYVYNSNFGSDFNVVTKRQKLLREQGYFSLLSQIIQSCFSSQKQLEPLLFKMLDDPELEQVQTNFQSKMISRPQTLTTQTEIGDDSKKAIIEQISDSKFDSERNRVFKQQENQFKVLKMQQNAYFKTKKLKIINLCYDLISILCQDNNQNQEECAKHFDIFKNQIGYISNATKCLIQILSNNEKLLSLIYKQDFIPNQKQSNQLRLSKARNSDTTALRKKSSMNFTENTQGNNNMGSIMYGSFGERKISLQKYMSQKTYYQESGQQNTLIHFIFSRFENIIDQILRERQKKQVQKKYYDDGQQPNRTLFFEDFLDILNVLCCYKDQGITINQQLIRSLLYNYFNSYLDDSMPTQKLLLYSHLILPVKLNGEQLHVGLDVSGKLQWIELQKLFSLKFPHQLRLGESGQILINYFEKQLTLYSNLCYGRNYSNKNFLGSVFTNEVLSKYIWSNDLIPKIKSALLRIFLYTHIDTKPRTVTILPMLSKIVSDKNSENNTNSSTRIEGIPQQVDVNRIRDMIVHTFNNNIQRHTNKTEMQDDANNATLQQFLVNEDSSDQPSMSIDSVVGKQMKDIEMINLSELRGISEEDKDLEKIVDYLKVKDTLDQEQLEELQINVEQYFEDEDLKLKNCNEMMLTMVQTVKKLLQFGIFSINSKKLRGSQSCCSNLIINLLKLLKTEIEQESYFGEENKRDPIQYLKHGATVIKKEIIQNNSQGKFLSQKCQSEDLDEFKKIMKALYSKIIQAERKRNRQKSECEFSSQDENQKYLNSFSDNNRQKIQQFKQTQQLGQPIKINILRILIYYQEIRENFYLSKLVNFISNFSTQASNLQENEDILLSQVFESILHCMPSIMQIKKIESKDNTEECINLDILNKRPILHTLIQLFYQEDDYTLNFLTLKLIFKCFKQRECIFRNLKHLQIIKNKEDITLFQQIKYKQIQLQFDCEQSEIWLKSIQKIKEPSFPFKFVFHRVINNIQSFINLCYGSSNQDRKVKSKIQEIQISKQVTLRNLRVHEVVITLIKESEYLLKDIEEDQKQDNLLVRMIECCYEFLISFISGNNIQNKKILATYLDIFLGQQKDCVELGQTKLISLIFKDNYSLISSIQNSDIIDQFLYKITEDSKKGGHDPLYLEFFEAIIFYRKKFVDRNGELFLNAIIERYQYDIQKFLFLIESFDEIPSHHDKNNHNKQYQQLGRVVERPSIGEISDEEEDENGVKQKYKESFFNKQIKETLSFKTISKIKVQDLQKSTDQVNSNLIFEFDKKKSARDVPFIYQIKVLQLLNKIFKSLKDKQQIMQMLFKNTIGIAYLFNLLNKKDIFSIHCRKVSLYKYILNTILKQILMKFAIPVWLKSDKIDQESGKQISEFIQIETEKLKNLNKADIDHFRFNKRTCYAYKNKQEALINNNDRKQNQYKILCDTYFDIDKIFQSNFLSYLLGVVLPVVTFLQQNKYKDDSVTASQKQDSIIENNMQNEFVMFKRDKEVINIVEFVTTFQQFMKSFVNSQMIVEISPSQFQNLRDFKSTFQTSLYQHFNFENIEASIKQQEQVKQEVLNEFDPVSVSSKNKIEPTVDLPLQDLINQKDLKFNDNYEKNWRTTCINLLTSSFIKSEIIDPEIDTLHEAFFNLPEQKAANQQNRKEYSESLNFSKQKIINKFMLFIYETLDLNEQNSNLSKEELPQSRKIIIYLIQLLIDILRKAGKQNKKIQEQNSFLEMGNLEKLLDIMCRNCTHDSVFQALLGLAIELLDGGNKRIQEGFYSYFMKNNQSETFFFRIYGIMSEEIESIKEKKSLNQRIKQANKKIQYCYKDILPNTTTNILRFLQLLAENHNSKLQSYIFQQKGSRNSYDLLNLIVQVVEALQEHLNTDNYDKLVQCFDTLTEFVQGPCEENQKALSEGKFMEIATNILNIEGYKIMNKQLTKNKQFSHPLALDQQRSNNIKYLTSLNSLTGVKLNSYDIYLIDYFERISAKFAQEMKLRLQANGNYQEDWMISRLQYKCIITLESLLEGNNHEMVISRLIKIMPLQTIKNNMILVYRNYKEIYGNKFIKEAFNHSQLSTDIEEYENQETFMNMLCLITESGFKLYFILRKMMEYYTMQNNKHTYSSSSQQKNEYEFKSVGVLPDKDIEDVCKIQEKRYKKEVNKTSLFSNFLDDLIPKVNLHEIQTLKNKNNTDFIESFFFYFNHTGEVDILFQEKLQRIYFIILPFCQSLTKDDIEWFISTIDRSSQLNKQLDIIKKSRMIIAAMKQEYHIRSVLEKKSQLLSRLNLKQSYLRALSGALSVVQNIIFLAYTNNNHLFYFYPIFLKMGSETSNLLDRAVTIILIICELFQIVIAVLILAFYAVKFIPLIQEEATKYMKEQEILKSSLLTKLFIRVKFLMSDPQLVYRVLFLSFAILGVFHFVFMALLLIDFFVRTSLLRNVFKSIWKVKMQLFYIMVLYVLIQYFFAIVAYYTIYSEVLSSNSIELCNDLWQCFSMILDLTFKSDGGFVGVLNRSSDQYKGWGINFRAVYDFFYSFIVCLLMIEMLSGIIIDAFATIRTEQEELNSDKLNLCLICGLERKTADKNSGRRGFFYHSKYQHNVWYYIFYIANILGKERIDFTGIETYVNKMIKHMNVSWFPVTADDSENDQSSNQKELEIRLQSIDSQLSFLKSKMESLEE